MAALLLLLAALCLSSTVLPSASALPANATLISDACHHTTVHYDLCVQTISDSPKSNDATDVPALISIVIEAASSLAINTSTYVDGLNDASNDTTDGPASQDCLEDCTEEYLDVTSQLDSAELALEKKTYKDLEKWVQTAMADVKTCQESCLKGDDKNFLTKRNGDLDRLTSVILSLAKLMPQ